MKTNILIVFFIYIMFPAYSQVDSSSYKIAGIGFGANLTKTDLSVVYKKPTLSFSAYFQLKEAKKFNSSFLLSFGTLVSEDRKVDLTDQSEFQINSFAQTNYQSLNYELSYNILLKDNWGLGISQGFGFMRFTVYDENNNDLNSQLNTRAPGEDYAGFSVIVPSSLYSYYFFENNWGIKGKVSVLNTLTDYLDNISEFGNSSNNDNILRMELSVIRKIKFNN